MRPSFARALREPLVQFGLFAALAFGLHAARRPRAMERVAPAALARAGDRRIELPRDFAASLQREATRRAGVALTGAELRAEVDRYVDDEVLFREALALGLDRGDVIVRRRLVQKMEFVVMDEARIAPPDDAALGRWVASHAERYRAPATVSFTQVYVSNELHGADAGRLAGETLAALRAGARDDSRGDPFALGARFTAVALDDLDGRFGDGFGRSLADAPLARWVGPVRSRYGLHLVRVDDRVATSAPSLDAVRARAREDLMEDLRASANHAAITRLRARYEIVSPGFAPDGGEPQ